MKWLSGDFVAVYNRFMAEHKDALDKLNDEYDEKFNTLVKAEEDRLEDTVPIVYPVGTQVVDHEGHIGTVVKTEVVLDVKGEIEQERPTGYWPIRNESDESVVTIDGDLRRYHVEFGSNPIARDYGIETEIVPLYLEEIKRKL